MVVIMINYPYEPLKLQKQPDNSTAYNAMTYFSKSWLRRNVTSWDNLKKKTFVWSEFLLSNFFTTLKNTSGKDRFETIWRGKLLFDQNFCRQTFLPLWKVLKKSPIIALIFIIWGSLNLNWVNLWTFFSSILTLMMII